MQSTNCKTLQLISLYWLFYFTELNKDVNSHLSSACVCFRVVQPSQPSGVMSSAVSLPNHTFTGQVNQYCAHSFARDWQLPFLNPHKGENGCRKYFMISLHERMLLTQWGLNPQPRTRIQLNHLGRLSDSYFHILVHRCDCRPRWLSWMRRPTGDQEVAGSTPAEVGNILSWRLIMKYFLRSFSPFRWFKKGSCQFLAKECAQYWLTA